MVRGHLAGEPSTPDPVGLGDELLPAAPVPATWTLPAGELPGALHVRSVVGSEVVERDVELGTLPLARR